MIITPVAISFDVPSEKNESVLTAVAQLLASYQIADFTVQPEAPISTVLRDKLGLANRLNQRLTASGLTELEHFPQVTEASILYKNPARAYLDINYPGLRSLIKALATKGIRLAHSVSAETSDLIEFAGIGDNDYASLKRVGYHTISSVRTAPPKYIARLLRINDYLAEDLIRSI
jgi:hypothetical protein